MARLIKCGSALGAQGACWVVPVQMKTKRENREAEKEHFKVCDLENAASLPDKIQGWWSRDRWHWNEEKQVVRKVYVIYILPPSKVEASSGVERNILVCTEATQGSGGGLEVSILLATVVERKYSKCCRLHEKSGCRVVGQGLRAG